MPSPNAESQLPAGWIQQFDEQTNHPFWVDTRAKPPRAIWVHPYEDEQFFNEHPDIRDRLSRPNNGEVPSKAPPTRHSIDGSMPSRSRNDTGFTKSDPTTREDMASQKHRGFFRKLKDKAIHKKGEREEVKGQQEKVSFFDPW